jgi:flagellar basal body-associated protein FliL
MTNITVIAAITLVGVICAGLWLAKKFSKTNRETAKPIAPAVVPEEKHTPKPAVKPKEVEIITTEAPKITVETVDDIDLEDPVRKARREKDRERKKRRRERKRLMRQQLQQS